MYVVKYLHHHAKPDKSLWTCVPPTTSNSFVLAG